MKIIFSEAEEILILIEVTIPGRMIFLIFLSRLAFFSQPYMISRLLIEPNRSLHHPQLFSEFTRDLSEARKDEIIEEFYLPYRHFESKDCRIYREG